MRQIFDRLNWQTVIAFCWFCACVSYALTHVPAETWERIARINIYALCAGIAALLGAVHSFFRGPVVKPPQPTLTVSSSYPSMPAIPPAPPTPPDASSITSVNPPPGDEDES